MCGIAGIVHFDRNRPIGPDEHTTLHHMVARLQKRGPDEQRVQSWGNVGFGFARLSIVDLAHGHQPLANEDESLWLMVNGEFYNHQALRQELVHTHRFRCNSDSEILLHLYEERGIAAIEAINGMFAAVLLDTRQQKLYLIRDRLGIKPLYYHKGAKALIFGSEIKALLAHPEVPKAYDWAAALQELAFSDYARPERPPVSMFCGIEYLPAGSILEVDLVTGDCSLRTYWDLARFVAEPYPDHIAAQDHVERYRELLDDSVRLRLMADVEYGMFLSGGIDSVSVAALAAKHGSLHTFSVLGQSTLGNGDAKHSHLAARSLGLPNHQVFFDFRSLVVSPSQWRQVLWDCEFVTTNAEQVYKHKLHAFAKETRPDLKVILLGQGSDEFNGGYIVESMMHTPLADWSAFDQLFRQRQGRIIRSRSGLAALDHLLPQSWLLSGELSSFAWPHLLQEKFTAELAHESHYASGWQIYRDIHRRSLQMYQLWHEDRTSSANSIESRVPFLDHRIVEHLCKIPACHHAELFWRKQILRRAMKEVVPDFLREREKGPFFYGDDLRYTRRMIHGMLCAENHALIEEAIAASDTAGGILHADMLRQIVQEMPQDPEYSGLEQLLMVVNMSLLSRMASDPPVGDRLPSGVHEITIEDWETWERETGSQLSARHRELSRSSVIKFAQDVMLVRGENGDPTWIDEGAYYLLQGTALRFMIEGQHQAWIRFLLAIDGCRSVDEILHAAQSQAGEVWKHLEEAFEHGILTTSPAEAT